VAVVQSWPVFGGFSIKIGIKISLAGLRLAVVDSGRYSEVAVNTGLTVSVRLCKSIIFTFQYFKIDF
jgi:hypothetical protein